MGGHSGVMQLSRDHETSTGVGASVQTQLQRLPIFARELIAGGVAGGLAKTCVAPLERAKIIFQTRGGDMTVSGVLKHIWEQEGIQGLFRGNTASVLRIVPYAAIHFGSFEYVRRSIVKLAGAEAGGHGRHDSPSALPLYDLLAGSTSGAVAVVATYPLDLVRTRLAWETEAPTTQHPAAATTGAGAGSGPSPAAAGAAATGPSSSSSSSRFSQFRIQRHHPPGIWSMLKSTATEEGLAGLYRGCTPTLLGILPYAGLKFYCYQAMKNRFRAWQSSNQQQTTQQQQQPPSHPMGAKQHPAAVAADNVLDSSTTASSQPPEAAKEVAAASNTNSSRHKASQQAGAAAAPPQKLPVVVTLVFGGVAGLVAQTVTYPLDVIRRQMQVSHLQLASQSGSTGSTPSSPVTSCSTLSSTATTSSSNSNSSSSHSPWSSLSTAGPGGRPVQACLGPSSGTAATTAPVAVRHQPCRLVHNSSQVVEPCMMEVAKRLWSQGGLFRGLSINYLKVVPSTAIGFTMYDFLKAYLGLTHSL